MKFCVHLGRSMCLYGRLSGFYSHNFFMFWSYYFKLNFEFESAKLLKSKRIFREIFFQSIHWLIDYLTQFFDWEASQIFFCIICFVLWYRQSSFGEWRRPPLFSAPGLLALWWINPEWISWCLINHDWPLNWMV